MRKIEKIFTYIKASRGFYDDILLKSEDKETSEIFYKCLRKKIKNIDDSNLFYKILLNMDKEYLKKIFDDDYCFSALCYKGFGKTELSCVYKLFSKFSLDEELKYLKKFIDYNQGNIINLVTLYYGYNNNGKEKQAEYIKKRIIDITMPSTKEAEKAVELAEWQAVKGEKEIVPYHVIENGILLSEDGRAIYNLLNSPYLKVDKNKMLNKLFQIRNCKTSGIVSNREFFYRGIIKYKPELLIKFDTEKMLEDITLIENDIRERALLMDITNAIYDYYRKLSIKKEEQKNMPAFKLEEIPAPSTPINANYKDGNSASELLNKLYM